MADSDTGWNDALSHLLALATRLESIPLRDWWRIGQHEEFGTVTLRQQVSYFASHEITHLPQIELLRRQLLE